MIFLTLYLAARLLPEWVGTDAGTDTSEKVPIGGRTSLTQLDTWLEAMDGETLCLTGKVTDCWQPVDGAQENASFLLKDLSIEADASSFVFSGDSAEMTDNLSQISGSADADQMSVLISSQKTTSQINEMQEIFGKNASALCYLEKDTTLPKAGSYVRVLGEVSPFLQATNPGEFDAAAYYRRKDCLFALRKTKITAQTKNYGRLEEFLSQLRYESEVLFRKLLGEKNGATASAMVLGRKKGMDSEVKALYQGAGISHLLAISGLHLSLIGAGLFGLLKKVRLPVALSVGISIWILVVYAQLTGMGISTRRALVMFLLFLAAGLLKRTPDLPTAQATADSGCRLPAFFFGSARDCRDDSGFAGWLGGRSTFAASHRWSCRMEYCPGCHRPGLPLPPSKYPCRSGHYHDDAAVSADSFL